MEMYFVGGAFVCALLAAAWDLRKGRIPNRLTYGWAVAALLLRAILFGWRGIGDGIAGGFASGAVFFLFFLVRAMGGGDVKLMAAVGCLAGVRHALPILLASAIAGGILAVGYMISYRRGLRTLRNLGALLRFHLLFGLRPHPEINVENPEAIRIPYAVAIAAGTFYSFGSMLLRR